ncbi:MAG TPA: metal ABC transporter permease, partial [Kiritimatiellia bacterium]|nr:metal ABC transporter permease [Kiritimatiellia bacterium]HMO99851.1 metal ABC transporter permease [Kiritimatiellia bacterium]HMP96363.1 metal ABC transporter permease [Kiritimatiellia bacterium]
MTWLPMDTWIVITGALCAIACAAPGCFLVLRKMSMMGDAISHAVLPGLAAGFLLTGSRTGPVMLAGAAVVGIATAVFTQWINRLGQVDRGASMGIVFTTLFALGMVMIVRAADHVDLDPSCVLYGAIEMTPLDVAWTTEIAGVPLDVPRAVIVLAAVAVLNLLLIAALFKEFRISAFDPALAKALGINAQVMHYLLMAMTAITSVAAFEAVGSIMVIAMLIVPAATAYLLTDRLGVMLGLSIAAGIGSAVIGHVGAITVPGWFGFEDTSTSGMMALAAGLLFLLAWLFAP